jgi:SAM-dependent methyltransferase
MTQPETGDVWWRTDYRGRAIRALPGIHEGALALLQAHVPPPARIADLGCGNGAFALRAHDAGYDVVLADNEPPTGLDLTTRMLDLDAPADYAEAIGESYDAVVVVEVIEHLESPYRFLRQLKGLLRPGGVLLVTTPSVVDLDSRLQFLLRGDFWLFPRGCVADPRSDHLTILPYWFMEEIFVREGWRVVERRFIGTKPRRGAMRVLAPLASLALLPFGVGLPLAAAFAPSAAFVCTR